jgi:uncharacterized protein (TIGR03437 family)
MGQKVTLLKRKTKRHSGATRASRACAVCLATIVAAGLAAAQQPEWRRIGNSAIDLQLAGVTTGAVNRVWYSADGGRLFVRTSAGQMYETSDFESWKPAVLPLPALAPSLDGRAYRAPEPGARVRLADSRRYYAAGKFVWRSEDGGRSWANVTGYKNQSILGEGHYDIVVAPGNIDEIVVGGSTGIWRSLDGGKSWSDLNGALPNLSIRKLVASPSGTRGFRVMAEAAGRLRDLEWAPGERLAWRPAPDAGAAELESNARSTLAVALGTTITAFSALGDYVYAGSADGRLWVSADRGRSWGKPDQARNGSVEAIFVNSKDQRVAVAARGARLMRTFNGGQYWDDISSNLPDATAHGIIADGNAVYVATDKGAFWAGIDLSIAGPVPEWRLISQGLPASRINDVRLDAAGNQLFLAVEGYGVYAAQAPHLRRSPRVLNSADFSNRAAAPGSLLSVLGANVDSARTGSLNVSVLAAAADQSQIQIPFEITGQSFQLALRTGDRDITLGLPLEDVSPAVFVEQDGAPKVYDAESGVTIDSTNPARAGARIQILAAGLGRVRPNWPTGLAAPLENPPQVAASVQVLLDGTPVETTRATLAPGYIGYYLIEAKLPDIVNTGAAELSIIAGNSESNRVRIYLMP